MINIGFSGVIPQDSFREYSLGCEKTMKKNDVRYEVFESKYDETETIECFDYVDEALGFLFTLFENKKGRFYVDKWIGHGLNSQVEAIEYF